MSTIDTARRREAGRIISLSPSVDVCVSSFLGVFFFFDRTGVRDDRSGLERRPRGGGTPVGAAYQNSGPHGRRRTQSDQSLAKGSLP